MKKYLIPVLLIGGVVLTSCGLFGNNTAKMKETGATLEDAIESLDVAKCETLDTEYKESCIKAIQDKIKENSIDETAEQEIEKQATEQGDPSLCEKIVSENTKADCESNATFTKALKEKNPSYCKNLKQEELISACENALK